jgi:glutathionylspermidine synthase
MTQLVAPTTEAIRESTMLTLRAGEELAPDVFARIRRRLVLDCCKWDPQVGDVSTLTPFPLLISRREWDYLCKTTEALAGETLAAEQSLLKRPDLHRTLGIGGRLRSALHEIDRLGPTASAGRIMRFDFHPTPHGWQISEVNSDVPGGYTEASSFTHMLHEHHPEPTSLPADPAGAWPDAIAGAARASGHDGPIALVSAPGFMEDQQVVAYLARCLAERGVTTHLANATHIRWRDGHAFLSAAWGESSLAAIVRFYQGEWLARRPRREQCSHYFAGGLTPVANPGWSILTESKRLPLVWDELDLPLPTWRRLLPETRDPRVAPWRTDDGWLLKSAFCNTGDAVMLRESTPRRRWLSTCLDVWTNPRQWIAQRRFDTIAIDTPLGPMRPCIGIYAVNGQAYGAYARIAPKQVIDYAARDVALLIEDRWEDNA